MNIKETLTELLPNVDISDEFVTKLTASIETTIAKRVVEETKAISDKLEEQKEENQNQIAIIEKSASDQVKEITEKANAYADYVIKEMTQKVEDYCEYIVEKFVRDNQEKLVETAEYARMAKVLRNIREAFETNFFQLNPEPASVDIEKQLSESKKAFNELFEDHRKLKRQIAEYSDYVESENRKTIFNRITENMADTQKERMERLVEASNFSSTEEYEIGISLLAEEFKKTGVKTTETQKPKEEKQVSSNFINEANSIDKMKSYLERL